MKRKKVIVVEREKGSIIIKSGEPEVGPPPHLDARDTGTYLDDLGVLEFGVLLQYVRSPDGLVAEEWTHGLFGSVLVSLHPLGLFIALFALGVTDDCCCKRLLLIYR